MRRLLSLMLLAVASLVVTSCESNQHIFPSTRPVCLKKGAVVIAGFDARNDQDVAKLGDNHALYILNPSELRFEQILSYGRHLKLFWNRDQTHLAIIDSEGSNTESFYVYDLITMELHRLDPPITLSPDDHLKLEFLHWNWDNTVSVRISCYGSQQLVKTFRYPLP